MDAAVVDDVGLHHAVAARFEDLGEAVAEQVVAHVTQVKWLVGVGRRIFDHHERRFVGRFFDAVMIFGGNGLQHAVPEQRFDYQVEEALHHIEARHGGLVVHEPLADFGADGFGCFAGGFHPGEYHYGEISFKFLASGLRYDRLRCHLHAVESLHGRGNCILYDSFDRHIQIQKNVLNKTVIHKP